MSSFFSILIVVKDSECVCVHATDTQAANIIANSCGYCGKIRCSLITIATMLNQLLKKGCQFGSLFNSFITL